MNKLSLYVLLLVTVAVVFGQNPPTPSGSPDQGTQATPSPTPTPDAAAQASPTPDNSAVAQPSATPQASATPDTGAIPLPTPQPSPAVTPSTDIGTNPQASPTPMVAVTPEATPTATPETTPQPTATPAPTAVTSPTIALTNRKEVANAPTDSDMYCSGFISPRLPDNTYVVGGLGSPNQTRFQGLDTVYLHGPTLPTGSKVLLLRHIADPMAMTEAYPDQRKISGQHDVYQELGIATIDGTMNKVMTATFNLVCDPVLPADIAIPLPDRIRPSYRPTGLLTERLNEPSGKLTGRIIMANEFDWVLGTGRKAYLNLNASQIKPGDYLKITRTYTASMHDPLDKLEFSNNTDELTRKQKSSAMHRALVGHNDKLPAFDAKNQVGTFPHKTVGEMMVLYTTPTSATGIVTASLEPIYVGDAVELEEVSAEASPTPVTFLTTPGTEGSSASAGANAPTINCQPLSPSVHSGETASVTCTASSPDNHPVTVAFESSRGRLQSTDRGATVDTRGLNPGPLSVKAVATDDRNLSSSATTLLNVDEPVAAEATPTPAKVADLNFKRNSSYVDNRSKAVLDDVALRLQKDPNSSAVLVGSSATGEPASLAEQRAKNAATYLTKDKGIAPERIHSQAGPAAGPSGAAVWIVPPGATMPDLNAPVTPNPSQNPNPNLTQPDNTTPAPVQPNTTINPGTTTPDTTTTPNTATPNTTANPDATPTPLTPGQVLPQHRPIGPPETR